MLGFDPKFLKGKKVLNYGSGGSNIGKELKKKKIPSTIYDADILPNPHAISGESKEFTDDEIHRRMRIMGRKINESGDPQMILPPVIEHENKLLGIEGRNLIEVGEDGKINLPDKEAEVTLLLWVYHQIPQFDRRDFAQELFRVTKDVLFVAPVWHEILGPLVEVAKENGFELMKLEATNAEMEKGKMKINKPEDLIQRDLSGEKNIDMYVFGNDNSGFAPESYAIDKPGRAVFVSKEYLEKIRSEKK
jgi:hypothetical protein